MTIIVDFTTFETVMFGIRYGTVDDVAHAKSMYITLVNWTRHFSGYTLWTIIVLDIIAIFQEFADLSLGIVRVPITPGYIHCFFTCFQALFGVIRD